MTEKTVSRKSFVEKTIKNHLDRLKVEDCLFRPEVPEVIKNPSFLVVPKLGSLLALYVHEIPEPSKLWMFVLEIIEDLFEVKIATGVNTTVALILIESEPINTGLFNLRLVERLFDKTIQLSVDQRMDFNVRRFVDEILSSPQPKQEFMYIWETEAKARIANFKNNSKINFVSEMLTELETGTQLLVSKEMTRAQLRKKTASLEFFSNQYTLFREPKVNNIKEHILSNSTSYYFTFDFGLIRGNEYLERGHYFNEFELQGWIRKDTAFINVMRGSNKSYPHLNFLRRMATYARFISYHANSWEERALVLREPQPKLYMILDGSLIGPDFDPTRYMRLLLSTGWTPIRFDTFSLNYKEGSL